MSRQHPQMWLSPVKTGLLTLFILAALSGMPASAGPTIQGIIVDDATNQPIADVYVIGIWEVCLGGWHCSHYCAHTENAKTNQVGHFSIPTWNKKLDGLRFFRRGYNPGNIFMLQNSYQLELLLKGKETQVFKLRKFQGTRDERLKQLEHVLPACEPRDRNSTQRVPVYLNILEEVAQFPKSAKKARH